MDKWCKKLKLLFWNLNKNDNTTNIVKLIKENKVDIAIFSEFSSTDFSIIINALEKQYYIPQNYGGCNKILLIAKSNINVITRREQSRYILYSFIYNDLEYILCGTHLPANPTSDADARKNIIRELVIDIKELENNRKHKRSIVIGDFNANPFDTELIQKDCFNAVLFKDLILKSERITYHGKYYTRFYNPTLCYISEDEKQYGSYYNSNGISSLYWYLFDQVIVRKELADSIVNVQYLKKIGELGLINKKAPNKSISDHLPLLATIE